MASRTVSRRSSSEGALLGDRRPPYPLSAARSSRLTSRIVATRALSRIPDAARLRILGTGSNGVQVFQRVFKTMGKDREVGVNFAVFPQSHAMSSFDGEGIQATSESGGNADDGGPTGIRADALFDAIDDLRVCLDAAGEVRLSHPGCLSSFANNSPKGLGFSHAVMRSAYGVALPLLKCAPDMPK
jgi:hypothetical protein